jgi:hypothetical protein
MIRLPWLSASCAAAIVFSLLSASISTAAPYYVDWSQIYKDTTQESQRPHAVALDSRGNVFVTGEAEFGQGLAFYTAKYDALDGHLIWERMLSGSGTQEFVANDIAVDSAGDCVVTGYRNVASSIDYCTMKYHGTNGTNFWPGARIYNGPNDGQDTAVKVVCDTAGNVIVTGYSVGNNINGSTGFDFATIKYASADGSQLAIDRYTASQSNLDDVPAGLAVDSANNIFVVGTAATAPGEHRFYIRKLKSSDLTKLWDISPIDTGDEGGATAVAIDSNDSVVATGMYVDASSHFGYFTAKYDTNGVLVWKTNNPPVSESTFGTPRPGPTGVAIGPDNNPVITGKLLNAAGQYVIRNVKYTSGGFFGGEFSFWDKTSIDTGLGFGDSGARAIVADGSSNTIIVGETDNSDANADLYIAKYDALTGDRVYGIAFSGGFGTDDKGTGIAVDQFGTSQPLVSSWKTNSSPASGGPSSPRSS